MSYPAFRPPRIGRPGRNRTDCQTFIRRPALPVAFGPIGGRSHRAASHCAASGGIEPSAERLKVSNADHYTMRPWRSLSAVTEIVLLSRNRRLFTSAAVMTGLEPAVSSLTGWRTLHLFCITSGRDGRIPPAVRFDQAKLHPGQGGWTRTSDILLPKEIGYQLPHTLMCKPPPRSRLSVALTQPSRRTPVVRLEGLEPSLSDSRSQRFPKLSYSLSHHHGESNPRLQG